MIKTKASILRIISALWIIFLASCSGSSSSTTPATDTNAAELAVFVKWAGHAWNDLEATLDSNKSINTGLLNACAMGGSINTSSSPFTLTGCTETDGGSTYTTTGQYTVTISSTILTTHEWNYSEVIVDFDTEFSSVGLISFDKVGNQISFDYSATFLTSGTTYRLTGSVSDNLNGTSDVVLFILKDGVIWQTGLFDDVSNTELDSLTDTGVNEACDEVADGSVTCAILSCSNNFECQSFAERYDTDAYETGNIQCSSGCCEEITNMSECPGSSPCAPGDDFSCQSFALEDETDAFETANSICGDDGCCTTTN